MNRRLRFGEQPWLNGGGRGVRRGSFWLYLNAAPPQYLSLWFRHMPRGTHLLDWRVLEAILIAGGNR